MTLHQEAYKSGAAVPTGTKFTLSLGGLYQVDVIATFGGGTVKLQKIGPDGATVLPIQKQFSNAAAEIDLEVGSFAANGSKLMYLSPGQYVLTIATATAVNVQVVRVSVE